MIRNPIDTSFPVAGEAWFVSEVFLMACAMPEVERVERVSENGLRIWPAAGYSQQSIAQKIQEAVNRRYGQAS